MSRSLEDVVKEIVDNFVLADVLFTALDVSNEVKKVMPFAKHREVRDYVRGMYNDMQSSNYGRTPIQVVLADGSQTDALLYHPLADSWDLDTKYDAQKRNAGQPVVSAPVSAPVAVPAVVVPKTAPVSSSKPLAVQSSKDPKELWKNLFGSVDLFPTS